MSESYFSKFPLIDYDGSLSVNITERVVVRDFPAKNNFLYYPYDIDNNERPDQLADRLLNDQYMSWIVYLSNGITDPYYDWYMADNIFSDYLQKKYGNIDKITAKIIYYRNNWYNDQSIIDISTYNSLQDITKQNAFGNTYLDTAKRYYEPVLTGFNITGYKRKRLDNIIKTNKIVKYNILGNALYVNNEIVTVRFGYNSSSNSTIGSGQVLTSNTTSVTIQHTSGYVDIAPDGYTISFSNSYVYGTESFTNNFITSKSSLANNITAADSIYWSPVTIYEDELERNLKNKTIRLINPSAAGDISTQMSDTLAALL